MRIPNADRAAQPAVAPKMRMALSVDSIPSPTMNSRSRIRDSKPHAAADRASAGGKKARLLA